MALFLIACDRESDPDHTVVEIAKSFGTYQFRINGEPFDIKGVGLSNECSGLYKQLKKVGGNAIRTWRLDQAQTSLDSAAKYGFMVALGIDTGRDLFGFDYDDGIAVQKQYERIEKAVDLYKDHPNLLCWIVGEELNITSAENNTTKTNKSTYFALNDIIDMIKSKDPDHPVSTSLYGINKNQIEELYAICPNLDFVSIQIFAQVDNTYQLTKSIPNGLPFMLSEFGPPSHLDAKLTTWGREIELLSGPKAVQFRESLEELKTKQSGQNLGIFYYYWGQRQERTPTWYSMFSSSCEKTELVDIIQHLWTGSYPENRVPHLNRLTINGERALDNIQLNIGNEYLAEVFCTDPEQDELIYKWHILAEVEEPSIGGAFEEKPGNMRFRIFNTQRNIMQFKPPEIAGEFRLYVYVYDGQGNVAYGNIPFLVV